jgi:hypothetical protein
MNAPLSPSSASKRCGIGLQPSGIINNRICIFLICT